MAIEWRTIPGFDDYEVSEDGRVRRSAGARKYRNGKELKFEAHEKGYLRLQLKQGDKRKHVFVHCLVAIAFIGPKPSPFHEVAHNDGERHHNHFSNLRWATKVENEADKFIHGTDARGSRNGRAKLTAEDVVDILARRHAGEARKSVAAHYGVTGPMIGHITSGRNWKHLEAA